MNILFFECRLSKIFLQRNLSLLFLVFCFWFLCLLPQSSQALSLPKCDVSSGTNPSLEAIVGGGTSAYPSYSIEPISDHYTRKVIDRAQKGINRAFSSDTAETFDNSGFSNWLGRGYGAMALILDTKVNVTLKQRDLDEVTPCLHIDLMLIETQIERARCMIQKALADKRYKSIEMLVNVVLFLSERYEMLLEGARDNTVNDKGWNEPRAFEPHPSGYYCDNGMCTFSPSGFFGSMWGCMEKTGCTETYMCPFHTDYLPPTEFVKDKTVYGYGCDKETLAPYSGLSVPDSGWPEAIEAEYELIAGVEAFRKNLFISNARVLELASKINQWMGRGSTQNQNFVNYSGVPPTHEVQVGCNMEPGAYGDPPSPLGEPDDEGRYPSMDYDTVWPPKWPKGALKMETHGPFSLDKNNLRLVREYMVMREVWGKRRPLYYRLPEEYKSWSIWNPFVLVDAYLQSWVRGELKKWDVYQEQIIAPSVPHATDTPKQTGLEFLIIRSFIGEYGRIANSLNQGTMRDFARGINWFIRRSCIDRPCIERLDHILKLILKESCFPYTNGQYMDGGQLWKKCDT